MVEIKGIIPAMLTPMHQDESVNKEELRVQVDRLIDAGVHGIFCFGTNGEGYILSEEEKLEILQIVIDHTAGRVPVYAGTGCVGTKDTIRLSQAAKRLGADVLSIICPYFAAASQEEVYVHYKTVAAAVDLPIVVYNIPARTGINIAPKTIQRLSEIDNIVGAKDSSGNFDNMLQYIELTRGSDFSILSGNDALILWNLLAGGTGGITGVANIYPETMVAIYENWKKGELDTARQVQDSIRTIRNCFAHGNPNTIVKAATKMLGYPVGDCRAPFNTVSGAALEAIAQALEAGRKAGMK